MSIRTFQKFEPSTKRGLSKNCQICSKSFSVLNVEHQCKRCLRAICKQCGKTKRDVYKLGMIKNPHRLCQICTKESDFIKQFISANQLKFGQDSGIGRKWAGKIHEKEEQEEDDQDREESQLYQAGFTYEMFCQVWDSYNYSMRELIGLLTFDKNQKQVYKVVNSVYNAIQHPQPLSQTIPLIMFLLCVSSPQCCIKLLRHLYGLSSGVVQQKLLFQSYIKALKVQQAQMKKITQYVNTKLKSFAGSLSVNAVSVQSSLFVLGRLFEKGKIQDLFIMFAVVVEDCIKGLVRQKDDKIQCDLELVKNFKLDKFMQRYRVASTAKISHLLKSKSPTKSQNFTESPSKTTHIEDNISNKTRSIRDQSSLKQLISSNEQRKTQKPLILPKIMEQQYQNQNYGIDHEQCYECQKNIKKIQDLQSKLKLKQRDIQNLNFMLNFSRKGSAEIGKDSTGHDSSVYSLERQIADRSEQSNLYTELSQQKRQNALLKSRIQQLQQSNKILKNALSSQPFSLSPSPTNQGMSQQESLLMLETLKQKLQTKSKQYEEVIKKNKLLNYQIEQMQREYSIKKPQENVGTREQLTKKLEQLSIQVNEEQEEKIKIANELFEAKQLIKLIEAAGGNGSRISYVEEESQLVGIKRDNLKQECNIF